jgi:hypothetical protein
MGVPGYNTVMEVAAFENKGLDFTPDLVFIWYVGNDLNLPHFLQSRQNFWSLRRSWLVEFLRARETPESIRKKLQPVSASDVTPDWNHLPDTKDLPESFRHFVGIGSFKEAMRRLKLLSIEHEFNLVVLTREVPRYLARVCGELDIPIVSMEKLVTSRLKEEKSEWPESSLAVSRIDPHPSAKAHRWFAETLFHYLVENDLIGAKMREPASTGP